MFPRRDGVVAVTISCMVTSTDNARPDALARIRQAVIGDHAVIDGPFGPRRLVYADWTASGRALSFIEDFIRERVLPLYANTHTEASATGLHTSALREDARGIIHRAVGGTDADAVLFCGSGSTAAIDTLIRILGLSRSERPVVFIGPYEHHSNELPWRESGADVVVIGQSPDGRLDLADLQRALDRYADRPLKIGSFAAASNVTGIITDVDRACAILRRHRALSCWDYATAGPYLPIGMADKDAVFLSPHKFVGGPGTPGILVIKRALLRTAPPVPGGGTVLFVSPRGHAYHPDPVIRQEAGTPAIVESIRAGLAFALKEEVGIEQIRRRDEALVRRAMQSWLRNPNIAILGDADAPRLPIISFALRHPRGFLHCNFVAALLNDLFGIQARSGCFCAGPYLHRIGGVDDEWSARMQAECARGHLGAKLGFVRLSLHYSTSDEVVDYIIEAVHLLADHAWKLLPLYRFDPASGLRSHRTSPPRRPGRLSDAVRRSHAPVGRAPARGLTGELEAARAIVTAIGSCPPGEVPDEVTVSDAFERIRWFPLPGEALAQLRA